MARVRHLWAAVLLCLVGPGSLGAQVRPVVLVPGWGEGAESLEHIEAALIAEGWPDSSVVAIDFADPVGSNLDHAAELADLISELRVRHGTDAVDVIAHSMGGLAIRTYLLDRSARGLGPDVRRVVFLGTPHAGTIMAYLAWGRGASEMHPGSELLLELNRRSLVPEGTLALALWTPIDSHVVPRQSAAPEGVSTERVCCPTHRGLLKDPLTIEIAMRFLLDGVDGS